MTLVSVHIPKCCGSSFRRFLQEIYKSRFIMDYDDKPSNTPKDIRQQTVDLFKKNFNRDSLINDSCIHGHFMPNKYENLLGQQDTTFVTWLREPAERIASHYYFWKRTYKAENLKNYGYYRQQFHSEEWSFREFIFKEDTKNLYQQIFWKFPFSNFDFIGITEHFESDLVHFSRHYLGKQIESIPRINYNPQKEGKYLTDKGLIREIQAFHSEDYKIYEEALILRKKRIHNAN